MKPIIPFALLGALFAVGAASAATTNPVGYVSLGNTVGVAVAPSSDAALSIPLARPAAFSGAASSSTATTVTVSGSPGWTPTTQWTASPHLLVVTSGAEEGLIALITGNTADTLTVNPVVGDPSLIATTDSVRIEPAWTLLSYLPLANVPNGTQVILFSEAATGINLGAAAIYTKGPTNWFQTFGGSGVADNTVIYPGESFIVRTPAAGGIEDLVVTGEVPFWNHRAIIGKNSGAAQADTRISYFSPVGEPIGSANVPAVAGDQLIVFDSTTAGQNKAASAILTRGPSNWFGTFGVSGVQDGFLIGGGQGYVYRRAAAAPNGDAEWSDLQSYNSL